MNISKLAFTALLFGALMAFGCSSNGEGDGGNGGQAGTGGQAGNGGVGGMEPACNTSPQAPPALEDACTALSEPPSLANPPSCDTAGVDSVDHQLTMLVSVKDTNIGFNLDAKDTNSKVCSGGSNDGNACTLAEDCPDGACVFANASCIQGGLSSADGDNGVDNQVAGLLPVLAGIGSNLDNLDAALAAALCVDPEPTFDLVIRLAVSETGDCANAQLVLGGAVVQVCDTDSDNAGTVCSADGDCTNGACADLSVPMNFVSGCLSGTLPISVPISVPGETEPVPVLVDNFTIAATADQAAGFSGLFAGTVEGDSAVALAAVLNPAAVDIVGLTFDILQSLADEPSTPCDSISLVVDAGGVAAGGGGAGGG